MIESIAAGTVETIKKEACEATLKGLEKNSPFSDSMRPREGRMECPQLKGNEQRSDIKHFDDSDRPSNNGGIEQPKLRSTSEVKESNAKDSAINTSRLEENGQKILCRNEELAGKVHPVTGVPFEKRTMMVEGVKKEVVVPVFKSKFEAQLSGDKLKSSDAVQFKECNNQLKEAVDTTTDLRSSFTDEELEQIENGDTPDGYTWHHDAEVGKMQLVDTEKHQRTGHTGGRNIWGGGSDNR